MTNSPVNLNLLTQEEIRGIQDKANRALGEYLKTNQIIRDDVFNILELNTKTLYYPCNDDEICAFIVKRMGKYFTFINTEIPLEKQVFAAAHELYHLWYSNIDKWELLNSVILDNQIENNGELSREEAKANRFAAELLVPKSILTNELEIRKIRRDQVELKDIIGLMDVFLMPYKTIVRRLYEIEFIDGQQCKEFLLIPDRDENEGVMLWQKRLEICNRNNERTKRKKLGNLVDLSIKGYEQNLITFDKLAYLLGLTEQSPQHYDIKEKIESLPSEDEVLKMLEEDD